MKSENDRSSGVMRRVIIVSAISFLVVLLLAIACSIFLIVTMMKKNETNHDLFEYNFHRIYTNENSTSFGILRVEDEIIETRENGYVTFESVNGDYITMISDFKGQGQEYLCTGSCFCETDDEKRRTARVNVLSRGMIFLLTAASSIIAMNEAREYFGEKCKVQFSEDECVDDEISFELDSCIPKDQRGFFDECANNLVFKDPKKGPSGFRARDFICHGACKGIDYLTEDYAREIIDEFSCHSKYFCNEYVQVECPGLDEDFLTCVKFAKFKFFELLLSPMCEAMSLKSIGKFQKASVCEGARGSIHCIETGWDNKYKMPQKRPLYGRAKCKVSPEDIQVV